MKMKATLHLLFLAVLISYAWAVPFASEGHEPDCNPPKELFPPEADGDEFIPYVVGRDEVPIPRAETVPRAKIAPRTESGYLHGINVGHWLIAEPWMDTGKLFAGKFANAPDQYHFDQIEGASAALKHHWDTFFTESDVQRLKGYGFNALRLVIGYWAFDNSGTPYISGAAPYLDEAIGWARNAGMKVLIDLHGSPGSQNGYCGSGKAGGWSWQQGNNLDRSTSVNMAVVTKYGQRTYSDVVMGISIVNEPTPDPPNSFAVSQKWAVDNHNKIQAKIRSTNLNPNLQVLTHDSWMSPARFFNLMGNLTKPTSEASLPNGRKTNFGIDIHNYQIFTKSDNARTQGKHIDLACSWADPLEKTKAAGFPVYVGEWTAITKICVKADGTSIPDANGKPQCPSGDAGKGCTCTSQDTSQWSTKLIGAVRWYVEAQLDVFQAYADGDFVWAFGGPGAWGIDNLIKVGAWPNLISARQFSPPCGKQ